VGRISSSADVRHPGNRPETAAPPIILRRKADLLRYFEGLGLLEPGVVTCTRWRPDPDDPTADTDVYQFCGLARKP
jgi:hypothetical protein